MVELMAILNYNIDYKRKNNQYYLTLQALLAFFVNQLRYLFVIIGGNKWLKWI